MRKVDVRNCFTFELTCFSVFVSLMNLCNESGAQKNMPEWTHELPIMCTDLGSYCGAGREQDDMRRKIWRRGKSLWLKKVDRKNFSIS